MEIILQDLGKKYGRQWIFKNLNVSFKTGIPFAVTGPNGSGKTTLLKIISGWLSPTSGTLQYNENGNRILPENLFKKLDFIAPYTELIEELTLKEFLGFHFAFKEIRPGLAIEEFMDLIYLRRHGNKYLRNFSSGMKQRLKLGLGFYGTSPVLLLDEPTSNLDERAKKWYHEEISKIIDKKLIIIASNQQEEFNFAFNKILIHNYN